MNKSIESKINQLKTFYNEMTKDKEELVKEIQKIFTKLRNILNEREDKLLLDVAIIYDKIYFKEEFVKESEKLPIIIKNLLDKGNLIKKNFERKNELSCFQFNDEFDNYTNKVKEINKKLKKLNKYKTNQIKILFKSSCNEIEELEDEIKYFGNITKGWDNKKSCKKIKKKNQNQVNLNQVKKLKNPKKA